MLKIIARAKAEARAVLIKKVHWFLSYVCKCKFAACWVLSCRITCKWVLFPSIDVCFYWPPSISEINNRLVTACVVKTAT